MTFLSVEQVSGAAHRAHAQPDRLPKAALPAHARDRPYEVQGLVWLDFHLDEPIFYVVVDRQLDTRTKLPAGPDPSGPRWPSLAFFRVTRSPLALMIEPLSLSIGRALRAYREREGMAPSRVARKGGISVGELRAIEAGRTQARFGRDA